ncbi:MAG: hypothetical protein FIA97_09435 [Methylococcaceae bacterium]|nr:hypothetical protein [Methylococcaceae bacterium]
MTASGELIFLGTQGCTPKLRLRYSRGTHHQTILSYGPVRLKVGHPSVQLADGRPLEQCSGMACLERGIRQSTTTGALYLGFLNYRGAFWGDESEPDPNADFQLYLYPPEELFDRAMEFLKLGNVPELLVTVVQDQGFLPHGSESGKTYIWDTHQNSSLKLETIKLNFSLNASSQA